MQDDLMIEEIALIELEPRVEFSCIGGADCEETPDTYCDPA